VLAKLAKVLRRSRFRLKSFRTGTRVLKSKRCNANQTEALSKWRGMFIKCGAHLLSFRRPIQFFQPAPVNEPDHRSCRVASSLCRLECSHAGQLATCLNTSASPQKRPARAQMSGMQKSCIVKQLAITHPDCNAWETVRKWRCGGGA
jgi:hypothetical protein